MRDETPTPNHERNGQVIGLMHEQEKKDGKRRMYIEISVERDGKQSLQSRQTQRNGVSEVLKGLQGERFIISLVCNRSIVGYGTYHFTNESVVIEHEEGAGVGFLDRLFQ